MFLILQVYNSKALSDNASSFKTMVNELGAIKAVIDLHKKLCWKKRYFKE